MWGLILVSLSGADVGVRVIDRRSRFRHIVLLSLHSLLVLSVVELLRVQRQRTLRLVDILVEIGFLERRV